LVFITVPDVTHKIDKVDKTPKFVYQLILNVECLMFHSIMYIKN